MPLAPGATGVLGSLPDDAPPWYIRSEKKRKEIRFPSSVILIENEELGKGRREEASRIRSGEQGVGKIFSYCFGARVRAFTPVFAAGGIRPSTVELVVRCLLIMLYRLWQTKELWLRGVYAG